MKLKKILSAFLLFVFSFSLFIQCYGSFPLVKTVYKFNGSIGGKDKAGGVIRSIVMILLTIIPVYGISFLVDVLIFNLIEFWSGSPVNIGLQDNDLIEIKQENNRLVIYSKVHKLHFYAFKDKPGEFFILNNNEYVPIEIFFTDNKISIIEKKESKILISKELQQKELAYIQ